MASDPLILGFDTSAAHCAAALLSGDAVLDVCAKDMARGQAEHLMPMIEQMLSGQRVGWSDLSRIGVGVGPGNFSGIRISVSAARGLGLALEIPVIGVTSFAATALTAPAGAVAVVPAPQNQAYVAPDNGVPKLVSLADMAGQPLAYPPAGAELATNIARLALSAQAPFDLPAPLYIRPADAAPPKDPPPVFLDDPV